MARDLARIAERIATDAAFKDKLKKDPAGVAREMGWAPQELVTFEGPDPSKIGCGTKCGCSPSLGSGCGEKGGNVVHCPTSGQPGHSC